MEAGELLSAQVNPENVLGLGELILREEKSAKSEWTPHFALVDIIHASGDVTIFKSVGVGVQDVAIAHAVVDCARRNGLGTCVENYDSV